ncbi:LPXTG cell wall anchor domain-containing protein [Micromonospora sp. CPCC 206061]|uniref:LPXTG cell wall anchor domain-containing protein n=1 Tax=Micromonospora sp. CPCC 206061 TaxID=3122410 RepID=UPI002FEFACEB
MTADTADPVPANNTATASVAVGGEGADLRLFAPDVYLDSSEGNDPIPPGGTGTLWAFVQNQGDTPVTGVTVTIALPAHVWFTERLAGCAYYQTARRAVCSRADVVLVPAHEDDPENEEDPPSSGWFYWRVKVTADAPGPKALTGGTLTAAPIEAGVTAARAPAVEHGDFFTAKAPLGIEIDVDATDNTDEYTVFVAAATSPSPSPTPTKSPTPSPSASGGGSLPVTGGGSPGAVAAIGLATLLAGSILVFVARRRTRTSLAGGCHRPFRSAKSMPPIIEMTLLSVRRSVAALAAGSLPVIGGPIGLVTRPWRRRSGRRHWSVTADSATHGHLLVTLTCVNDRSNGRQIMCDPIYLSTVPPTQRRTKLDNRH